MAGYSKTPLAKKLGYKPGYRYALVDPPADYAALVDPLPDGAREVGLSEGDLDLVHVFSKDAGALEARMAELADSIAPTGALWVSWPKKASKVPTTVDEAVVRRLGLATGLVDNKICAVDATWSGLRFVVRVEDRPSGRNR